MNEIDFLRALGEDLRTAATRPARSRSRLAITGSVLAISLLLAGVVVIAGNLPGDHHSHHRPARPPTAQRIGGTLPPQFGYQMTAVTAPAPNDVWAFGYHLQAFRPGHPPYTGVILHFVGHRWTKVAHPGIGQIRSVASDGPNDIWAIGGRRILHWTGASWARVRIPHIRNLDMHAVSAASPTDVWVVGHRRGALRGDNLGWHTLAMHWNGSAWTVVRTPNPAASNDELWSVLALPSHDAWVIGQAGNRRLTLHWTGTTWQSEPIPTIRHHRRSGPIALGTDGDGGVWAAGATNGPGYGASLYYRWTGRSWVKTPSPAVLVNTPGPSAIAGSSPTDMWAVGNPCCDGYVIAHLVDGHWQDMRASLPADVHQFGAVLYGVAAVSRSDAWAVGSAYLPQIGKSANAPSIAALILHWDGKQWTPTGVPGLFSIGDTRKSRD